MLSIGDGEKRDIRIQDEVVVQAYCVEEDFNVSERLSTFCGEEDQEEVLRPRKGTGLLGVGPLSLELRLL